MERGKRRNIQEGRKKETSTNEWAQLVQVAPQYGLLYIGLSNFFQLPKLSVLFLVRKKNRFLSGFWAVRGF